MPGAPARVSVFGLSALPPGYLAALAALGRHADVTVYALNPCREMWFETEGAACKAGEQGRPRKERRGDRMIASGEKEGHADHD